MVTEFINYSEQIIRAARYIGQGLMITLSHANRLPVTIQYPYEKIISSERFHGRIHFEFDKCIACEVCVRVCPIDLLINSLYISGCNPHLHNRFYGIELGLKFTS